MYKLSDLRTRGVETRAQTQKVEKEMSDEEASHKEEVKKVETRVQTQEVEKESSEEEARHKEEVKKVALSDVHIFPAEEQAQKVLEKEMSDEEVSHKEEARKVEESRKKGRKEKLEKARKNLERAQKAQIAQHPQAKEVARKVQIQADICIRLIRAIRMKKKNVGLKLTQFQYKEIGVGCIEPKGKYMATKDQEGISSGEVEMKEDEQITFPAQEIIQKEGEERVRER